MGNRIEINSIQFKNILSYGNKWQEFVLKPGISFITGLNLHNDRRNFTGKSNLLKIFPYSLYGKIEGKNKQRIVNWKNKKNCEVYVKFSKKGKSYTIHRGIKPDFIEIYENDNSFPIQGKVELQKEIENDVLEMDYNSFMNIIYADTNNSNSIFTLSKPAKRTFLDQMFDLSYYSKIKDKALKNINQVEKEIQQLEGNIQKNENRRQDLLSQITDFRTDLENITDSTDKLKKYENSIKENKNKYSEVKDKIKELESQYEESREKNEKYDQIVSKILYKIREIEKYKTNRKVENIDIGTINKSIENLKYKISDLESQIVSYTEYADDYFEQVKSDCVKYETEISTLDKKYKELNGKINSKSDIVKCPTCFQQVDHKLIKQHFEREKESLDSEYEKIKRQLDIRKVEKKTIEKENQKKNSNELLEAEIESIEKKVSQYTEKKKQWEETERIKQKIEKYKKVVKKLKNTENYYNSLLIDLDIIINDIDKNKKFVDNYDILLNEREKLRDKVEWEKQEKDRIKSYVNKNNDKINESKTENQSLDKKLKIAKRKTDYLKCLKNLCIDEEVKQYAISNKIPILNKQVNEYLSKTGVSYYVKLDNWLDVEIKGPGRRGCTYQDLSGAERISIDRALQFSFSDLNKMQSPVFVDLLILDEVIGSNNLDKIGVENLTKIVKHKQQSDNSKVLIVSHDNNIKDFEYVDHFYEIVFDGSYSRINSI